MYRAVGIALGLLVAMLGSVTLEMALVARYWTFLFTLFIVLNLYFW